MVRRLLLGFIVFAVMAVAAVGAATASGPAPPGKDTFTITCGGGIGTVTVSVAGSEQNFGAAQIVGQHGHFILVSFTFSVFDVTTNTEVFSETDSVGGGKAHRNQQTTTCSLVLFEAPASDVLEPGEQLPPGVAPTDILRGTGTVVVIAKV